MAEKNVGITVKKGEDFSEWYAQVVAKAELADYTSVSGCMVLRPTAYALWEKIQEVLDKRFKGLGHKNVYFPLFIPESLFKKEADHVEGFSAEVAWVTKAGDSELSEKLAVRPTSETIMYESYAKWVRSWRDLPLLFNQWCNVVRWEFKYPKPFIRTREFLWQEGHTVHESFEEAEKETLAMLEVYKNFVEEYLAIPVISGKKSEREKFAGALYTTTIEALMPDGRALQMGTSHNLGQNFAKAFGISFLGRDGKQSIPWQTSWGVSTRMIGAVIMVHGDDKGLVLPPKIAPIQVVIVPIVFEDSKKQVMRKSLNVKKALKGFSVLLDDREGYTPGWKFNEWEMKGIPVRIEIGPKDIEKKQVRMVARTGKAIEVKDGSIRKEVEAMLEEIQAGMFRRAKKQLEGSISSATSMDDFEKALDMKMLAKAFFCSEKECEDSTKERTKGATTRAIPFDQPGEIGACIGCGKQGKKLAYFGRSY